MLTVKREAPIDPEVMTAEKSKSLATAAQSSNRGSAATAS